VAMPVDLLRSRVDSIAIEVTSKCNLRCAYCYKSDPTLDVNNDMSDASIEALYRHCKTMGIRNVMLSVGGETTIVAGWYDRIAQFLNDPELDIAIVSNFARLFDDSELTALTRFRHLQVSFDSASVETIRKLRSRADLRTITHNIVRLRQKGRTLGRHPFILVNCTVCRVNIGELSDLAGLCRELAVDQLLLTEVMAVATNNPDMPQTLDALTGDEVILLARQIIAAEDTLDGGSTALRLQERLSARLGGVLEDLRSGRDPEDAAGQFHRRLAVSACRLPWAGPLVYADGRVMACCSTVDGGLLGNIQTDTLPAILDGKKARAIRASILDGHPIVSCDSCSFARGISFAELGREIRQWLGDASSRLDSETRSEIWPGLISREGHPVLTENALLTVNADGGITLREDQHYGLHRVLIDLPRQVRTTIAFRVHPAGRRRLRLDFAEAHAMVGRMHLILTSHPQADTAIGSLSCRVLPSGDGWFSVLAEYPEPTLWSHFNLTLMREDGAVEYPGDTGSGVDVSDVSIC
jgi:molybdenum cofactor biosynthesis enzyme MoaA